MRALCLNAGSSSLKYALFEIDGTIERQIVADELGRESSAEVLDRVVQAIGAAGSGMPQAVGHRIVFGGPDHFEPALVTPQLLDNLERVVPYDPLHLRAQIDLVRAALSKFGAAPQVVCFDTAFHRAMPPVAHRIPIPRSAGASIQRYGFHGLSYEYIMSALGENGHGRVIIAHLGSGSSIAAVRDGRPIDTTMGFSPLGGVMMGSRTGDIDPGVLLHLLADGNTQKDLAKLLTEESGLLGVSELSADMKTLIAREDEDERARDAIELFIYQIWKHMGALIAVLGGVDTLVFTGGIGENAAEVRARIAVGLTYYGVSVDGPKNAAHADIISTAESRIIVRVIKTDECLAISRHVNVVVRAS